ncbi:flagellar basal body protein FliL [Marinomonas sp. UCMA 3892]|jgi:flagellar protein FliL|uniref:Flagellar protein FliL n=1 Tax=Marinomonas sp. (strain MWYL1) TaxID=400668 RepID=A6VTB5_MARMS|nr:flagellar basal body-associated FliL family protein [Marinomonas sp. UCMA 3892]NLU96838.1 flagellar basal body protein FliL [Marinomonas sp. UCMA 3892]
MSLMISLCRKLRLFTLILLCGLTGITSYAADDAAPAAAYIELKPTFVVNHLGDDARLKYIKTSISIRTDESKKDLIEANMPLVRDALVMFLSSRTTEQVTGAIAREKTREEAAIAVNGALKEETGLEPVKDILFASFVTQ